MSELSLPEPSAETVSALQAGDHAAFRQIYDLYKDSIYTLGLHTLGDPEQASEAAQKSFIKLYTVAQSFRGDSKFGTWFYRLAVNVCYDLIRQRRRTSPLTEDEGIDEQSGSLSTIEFDVTEQVRTAVQELPPNFRTIIVLRYIEGLSYDEIAKILECSIGTVGSRMNRAHKLLAKELADLKGEG